MNKRKILVILMIASTTVVSSSLVAVNLLKNNKEKSVVEINENISEEKTKKNDLLEKVIDNENQNLDDGEFLGEGKGYGGIIKVKVTVKNSKIDNIEVLSHSETPNFFKKAEVILNSIINKNSPNVDSISGATITSNGLKEAVINALKNHGLNDIEKIEKNKVSQKVSKNTNKVNLDIINIGEKSLKDGEYFGEAKGFSGNIKVKVIIKNGKISEIKLISHNDDEEFMNKAKKIIRNILDRQAVNGIDTVSGATYSSRGILESISNAISKAAIDNKNNEKHVDTSYLDMKTNNKIIDVDNTNKISVANNKKINIDNLKDGEYFGEAKGFRGNIKVKAIIKDGKISEIKLISHNDDDEFMNKAKKVIENVLDKQAINEVDTVSGATYSSKGILEAINDATSKAESHNKNKEHIKEKVQSNKKIIKNVIDFINTKTNKIMDVIKPNKANMLVNTKKDSIDIKTNVKVDAESFKDGEYFGSAEGFRGDLKVKTIIKGGKITTVDIMESEEDEVYLNSAKELISKILVNQNTNNIDTISGATYSSKAILNAVENSLTQINLNNKETDNKEKKKTYKKEENVIKDNNEDLSNKVFEGKAPAYYSDKYIVSKVSFKDNKIDKFEIIHYPDDDGVYFRKAKTVIKHIMKKPKETAEDLNKFVEIYEKLSAITDYDIKKEETRKLIGKYADEINWSKDQDVGNYIINLKRCIRKYMKSLNRGEVLDTVSGATYSARAIANSAKNAMDKAGIKTETNIKNINIKNKKVLVNIHKDNKIDLSSLIVEIEYNDGAKKEISYDKFKENNIKIYNLETREELIEDKFTYETNSKLLLEAIQLDSLTRDSFSVYFEKVSDNKLIKMEYSLDEGKNWSEMKNLNFYSNNPQNVKLNREQKLELLDNQLEKQLKIRIKSINGDIYELKYRGDLGDEKEQHFEPTKKDRECNVNLEYLYSIKILNDKYNKLNAKDISINEGEVFNAIDYIAAVSNANEDLNKFVKITENTVNTHVPGEYKVTYVLGNIIKTIKVTVLEAKVKINAVDKTIFVGEKFDPKFNIKAISLKGEDLTSNMLFASKVDVNKPGKYTVIYFIRDKENNVTKKIIYVTVKERPSKLNDGLFIGKDHGLYKDKFIQTKVRIEDSKVKAIDVSNEKSTYGDDIDPYREKAILIVDKILKDNDKTINDILEYDNILKSLSKVAVKNYNLQEFLNEGKRLIGDYSNDFKKIKINKKYTEQDIENEVARQVKLYLKSKGKGEALDTVSGATYSAVGITKSVKNAIEKSKTNIDIQNVVINGLQNNSYNIQVFDDELEKKKLDLSKISIDIYYKDGKVKNIPFNKFEENKFELINSKTNKLIDLNASLKDFEAETKIKLLNKEFLIEKIFNLKIKKTSSDFIKVLEYSTDDGKTWSEVKNPEIVKENLIMSQKFIVNDKMINKKIIARLKSEKNNIYYLNVESDENLIEQGKNIIRFNSNKEDVNKNNNIESVYRLNLDYKLSENFRPIIEAHDKTIIQGEQFNALDGVKATNKNGDDLSKCLRVKNKVESDKPGEYKVTYFINKTSKTINITVKKFETDKKTEFIVSDKIIKKGENFNPKEGVKVISKTGSDITNELRVASNVKINKVGEYQIIYYVRDLNELVKKNIKITVVE